MTTQAVAREAIYQRWVTNWGITTPYTFENESYTPPANSTWARLTIRHEQGGEVSLNSVGSRKFMRRGRVLVQIFDPVDSGTSNLDLLSDQARDVFEGASFSGLSFFGADIRESGSDGEYANSL